MAVIEKITLDDDTWQRLLVKAESQGRSVDAVVADMLTGILDNDPDVETALMNELSEGRKELAHIVLTDADINEAKNWGRR